MCPSENPESAELFAEEVNGDPATYGIETLAGRLRGLATFLDSEGYAANAAAVTEAASRLGWLQATIESLQAMSEWTAEREQERLSLRAEVERLTKELERDRLALEHIVGDDGVGWDCPNECVCPHGNIDEDGSIRDDATCAECIKDGWADQRRAALNSDSEGSGE